MIQVLHRAFDILEYIASDKSRAHPLSAIAKHMEIHPATCANIIKTMVLRGYLSQVSKKEGYKLGQQAYALTDNYELKEVLIPASEVPMAALAKRLNEGVILAVLNAQQRVILLDRKSTHEIQVINKSHKDVYTTSTGRVMLAFMQEAQLEKFVSNYGLPNPALWPQVQSQADLVQELAKIKSRALAIQTSQSGIVGLAVPLFKQEEVVASVGVYLPAHRYAPSLHEEIIEGLQTCAEVIHQSLNTD